MNIEKHAVVAIQYELKNDDGTIIDSSEGGDALVYLHGTGALVQGLEDELDGKQAGDKFQVSVSPDNGYGEFDEQLLQQLPREAFEGIDELEPGMQFRTSESDGSRIITVTNVADDVVTVDANHPLAGVTLNFSIEVESVREATPEEIDHGHVH